MIRRYLHQSLSAAASVLVLAVLSSCAVDEKAALITSGSLTGEGKREKKTEVKTAPATLSWAEKMKADQERKKAEQAEKAAAKAKEEAAETKKLAAAKKLEDAAALKAAREEENRLAAEKKARAAEEAAELAAAEAKAKAKADQAAADKKAREDALAAKVREREAAKLAKLEEKKKEEADRAARDASREVASANRGGGGFFSLLSIGTTSKQYKSEGHDIFVNEMLLPTLNPSNAKIEVSLGEQRARVYRKDGAAKVLVIDTQISSGKPGHATSTGTYHIKEKLVVKQSTLYGSWFNSSGQTVSSSGDSRSRPSGGSRFVGTDMPYWMRINGGIGMHIGDVPGYPASHGCIRVPETVQPLIYSKVGLGTQVTIMH